MKKRIGIILTFVFLILFTIYFFVNIDEFKILSDIPYTNLLIIGICHLCIIFVNGQFIKVILQPFKTSITMFNSFYLSLLSSIGNYFTPMRGGASIRAIYLKKKLNFPYSKFISTLSGTYIIIVMVNSFIALLVLYLLQITKSHYSLLLYCFIGLLFLSTLILYFMRTSQFILKIGQTKGIVKKIFDYITDILSGLEIINNNRSVIYKLLLLTVINFIISLIIVHFEFEAIGTAIPLLNLILYSSLSGLSLLISITPGSIGIKESILLLFSNVIQITNNQILLVAIIDRGVLFFLLFIIYIVVKMKKQYAP